MRILLVIVLALALHSCATKKDIHYFQDSTSYPDTPLVYQDATIQPNDILDIRVTALDLEVAEPYNVRTVNTGQQGGNNNQNLNGYVVTKEYAINFPILGKIDVKGLTTEQLEAHITTLLIDGGHLKDPTVKVRLMNGKFTVLGSVGSPGTINFTDQNITIIQAIGLAGDLTLNGVREDIMLIRETDGMRSVTHLDITSLDITSSPYYFIKPNDIIYVKQNGPEIKRAGYIPSLTALLGFATFTLGIIALISSN